MKAPLTETERRRERKHIAVLCATERGYRFLEKLMALSPTSDFSVVSFREENHEPPFLDAIRQLTLANGARFLETRNVGKVGAAFCEVDTMDLMLVVSWRYLIPSSVFRSPRMGSFVFHDSLLPEYRGFSPTVWAMINGASHTGVTLFHMGDDMDSGDIVDQQIIPIGADDTVAMVMERTTRAYLDLLERNLCGLLTGTSPRVPQDHARATYTCKRLPEDNRIDWRKTTGDIYNLIRAVSHPYAGAFTTLSGSLLRVWAAQQLTEYRYYVGSVPGRIVEVWPGKGCVVLTGDGALLLTQVQSEGGEVVCAADTLNRLSFTLGT